MRKVGVLVLLMGFGAMHAIGCMAGVNPDDQAADEAENTAVAESVPGVCLPPVYETATLDCAATICSDAQRCLIKKLNGLVDCYFGSCYRQLIVEDPCHEVAPKKWVISGKFEYTCKVCTDC